MLCRAYAEKRLDFSESDRSWNWRLKRDLVLRAMETADDVRIEEAALQMHTAMVGTRDHEKQKEICEHISNRFRMLVNLLRPWDKLKLTSPTDQAREMAEAYKSRIGDVNDPVFAAKLKEDLERLKNRKQLAIAERQAELQARQDAQLQRATLRRNRHSRRG